MDDVEIKPGPGLQILTKLGDGGTLEIKSTKSCIWAKLEVAAQLLKDVQILMDDSFEKEMPVDQHLLFEHILDEVAAAAAHVESASRYIDTAPEGIDLNYVFVNEEDYAKP